MTLQSDAARLRRDAGAAPLQDFEKHAQDFQKTFSEQLNALANSKNTKEVGKALKEGTDSVLQQLSALSSTLQSAVSTSLSFIIRFTTRTTEFENPLSSSRLCLHI